MAMRSILALVLGVAVVGTLAAADGAATLTGGPSAEGHGGMVVSVSRLASEAGRDVLRRGGNAVDAAVATAFALAVTWPEAGNLGGGGFMLIHPAGKGEPVVIDYRETAPAASTRYMFAGSGPPSPYLMVGVPGTVRGLALAHRKAGKLPWKDLVTPAVALAADGFTVDEGLARSLNRGLARAHDFPEFRRVLGKPDGPWKAGDRLALPDLAGTLRLIAEGGPDGFYKGPVAEKIVAEMKRGDGLITAADLAGYQARERKPIHGTYRGFDVYAPPPPSSGGICLVEMLNVLENFDLRKQGRWSPDTLHQMTESMRRAFCDRARHLGDPDFASVPTHLTDKGYAKQLAAAIAPDKATPSLELSKDIAIPEEKDHTTHFSVIDRDGMAVSNTYTLEDSFGGKVMVRGAGFLLNNEMGDFNPRPGVTTRSGQIGTKANEVAPGKRMLSSMCPTVVAKDGRAVLVTGSPGGRTIINTVLCVVVNTVDFDMALREAVDAPRLHHQWLPDRILAESALPGRQPAAVEGLRARGHTVGRGPMTQGDAHSIAVGRDGYLGVADRRLSGWAAGYSSVRELTVDRKRVSDTWERGDSYERYVGRWSRRVGPEFLSWLGIPAGRRWLDVGCGTGAHCTAAIVDHCYPSSVAGVEPSEGFLKAASEHLSGRATIHRGTATSIPLGNDSVDVTVSGLVLNFVPDQRAALSEMARVTANDGTIGAYVWDYAGKMELIRIFWDAATELDPNAATADEGVRFPLCRPEALAELFAGSGLDATEVMAIEVPTPFASFEDYWHPFLGGQGPAPAYVASLDETARERLRRRVRERVPLQPDGSIALVARAWAIRGAVRK